MHHLHSKHAELQGERNLFTHLITSTRSMLETALICGSQIESIKHPQKNSLRPLCVEVASRNFQRKVEEKRDPYLGVPFYSVFFDFCRSSQRQYLLSACRSDKHRE